MTTGTCKTCIHQWPIWVGKTLTFMCIRDTYKPKHVSLYDKCNDYKKRK